VCAGGDGMGKTRTSDTGARTAELVFFSHAPPESANDAVFFSFRQPIATGPEGGTHTVNTFHPVVLSVVRDFFPGGTWPASDDGQ